MSSLDNNATVIKYTQLPDCLYRIWIKPDWDAAQLKWIPGQFLRIGIIDEQHGKNALRAMTIIGIEDGVLEFYMVSVTNGVTSPRIGKLRTGNRCFVEPFVTGNFHSENLPYSDDFDLWMMGTGTGIAPYLAMLQYSEQLLNVYRNIVFVHSVQEEQHLCYKEEIDQHSQNFSSLIYRPVVTKAKHRSNPKHLYQRIPQLLKNNLLSNSCDLKFTPSNSVVLLCGQPGMIKDATEQLKSIGLTKHRRRTPGNILTERYF